MTNPYLVDLAKRYHELKDSAESEARAAAAEIRKIMDFTEAELASFLGKYAPRKAPSRRARSTVDDTGSS